MQGPEYTFTISGGYCTLDKDTKSVTCVKPVVTLEKTAGTCTLKYTSPTTAFVSSFACLPNAAASVELCVNNIRQCSRKLHWHSGAALRA